MAARFSKQNKAASILFCIALFFFVLTFSVALPIYIRPFYYAHISALSLPELSGFTAAQIRESYDAVLDYLTLPGRDFSAGVMAYSPEGAAHFADCKTLFDLNVSVLICSAVILIVLLLLRFSGKVKPFYLGRHSAAFYSGVAAICLPIVLGVLIALDFESAFVVFHKIFFPGKTNWLFDPTTDEIIRVLPQQFFMNCACVIGMSVLTLSLVFIAADIVRLKKQRLS